MLRSILLGAPQNRVCGKEGHLTPKKEFRHQLAEAEAESLLVPEPFVAEVARE